jgi:hypothetical protein
MQFDFVPPRLVAATQIIENNPLHSADFSVVGGSAWRAE